MLVGKLIKCLKRTYGFSFAQEQVATGRERKGKLVEYVLLEFGCKVDEHVAAQYQVDTRKRSAAAEVLLAEYDHLTQHF